MGKCLLAINRKTTMPGGYTHLTPDDRCQIEVLLKRGDSLREIGRTARLRRLTIPAVAEKIGTGVRAVADAEKGKTSTGAGVNTALLWLYGLLDQMDAVADLLRDATGQRLGLSREKSRARTRAVRWPTGSAEIRTRVEWRMMPRWSSATNSDGTRRTKCQTASEKVGHECLGMLDEMLDTFAYPSRQSR